MRPRWVQFDWSIAIVMAVLLHVALVGWILRDQIMRLQGELARGVASQAWLLTAFDEDGKKIETDEDHLGEADGKGTAIAASSGDRMASGPMTVDDEDEQPLLSRDPVGMGHIGDAPSKYTGPTGDGPMASAMIQPSTEAQPALRPGPVLDPPSEIAKPRKAAAPDAPVAATPTDAPPAEAVAKPIDKSAIAIAIDKPVVEKSAEQDHPAVPSPIPPPPDKDPTAKPELAPPAQPALDPPTETAKLAEARPAAASAAQHPGLPMASADPAPMSDSEIDVFTQQPSADFRAGKTIVRGGRKARLTRPRIPLVGFWDGVAMGRSTVVLRLTLDSTGKVIRADILRSSGSNEIDNPVALEAYNWWFEPYKNDAGEPIKNVFPFPVTFR